MKSSKQVWSMQSCLHAILLVVILVSLVYINDIPKAGLTGLAVKQTDEFIVQFRTLPNAQKTGFSWLFIQASSVSTSLPSINSLNKQYDVYDFEKLSSYEYKFRIRDRSDMEQAMLSYYLDSNIQNVKYSDGTVFRKSEVTQPAHSQTEDSAPESPVAFKSPVTSNDTKQFENAPEFISNELLVKVKKGTNVKENPLDTGVISINNLNQRHGVKKIEKIVKPGRKSEADADVFRWYRIILPGNEAEIREDGQSPDEKKLRDISKHYRDDPNIESVEFNYVAKALAVPNDPYFTSSGSWGQSYPDLWGMRKISPERAWDQSTGSYSIIVADVDTGVDRNHQDIAANMWVNTDEIPGNRLDDDGNGYIDDYYGWDFVNNDGDPMDDHGHGTHTVGTIAAIGNNSIGVVGVNWNVKIMALKFLNSGGSGSTLNGVKALQYAADMGAHVSSNSWGCACQSTAVEDAIKYEHDRGMVTAVAAGNSNADALDFSPASSDYAITVAATSATDVRASFSNYGPKIDVAAPGVDILSAKSSSGTMCGSGNTVGTYYCRVSGTSMATPHVAGLAALLLSKNSALTNEEVRQILRNKADDLGIAGRDQDFGYGRINASRSMQFIDSVLTPLITAPRSRTLLSGAIQIRGMILGPNFADYRVDLGSGRSPAAWTTLASSTIQPSVETVLATLDPATLQDGKYTIRIRATDTNGKTYEFQVFDIEVDNFDTVITYPPGLIPSAVVDVEGTVQVKNGQRFANYTLEWKLSSQQNWSTGGITLTDGGTHAINKSKLGTWNTSLLTNSQTYQLRLTAYSTIGLSAQYTISTVVDNTLLKGWPKVFFNDICYCDISPTIADIDGDDTKEIVIAAISKVYVFRKDGSNFPGFPVTLLSGTNVFNRAVTVDDLDGDGNEEIIAASSSGTIYVIRSNGNLQPGWSKTGISFNPTTVADLDADGMKDVLAMQVRTYTTKTELILHSFHINGSELAGFPKLYVLPPVGFNESAGQIQPTSYWPVLSTFDMDNDARPEIGWAFSDRIFLFDNAGNMLPGWPFIVPKYNNRTMRFGGPLAAGDVDGDGNKEVFAVSDAACLGGGCSAVSDTVLYGFRKDGSVLPGWPKTTLTDNIKSGYYGSPTDGPVLTDMDNDGKDEIIMGGAPLAIFDYDSKKTIGNAPAMYTQPALSDVDGEGRIDYTGGYYNSIKIVRENATVFSTYWQRSINGMSFYFPPAVADIENNGKMDLIFVSRPSSTAADGTLNLVAYLWEIPASGTARYEWPMFSHDAARSGQLQIGPLPPDTRPPVVTANHAPLSGIFTYTTVDITTAADELSTIRIYVDGILKKTCAGVTACSFGSVYTVGNHSYHATATDAAGNVGNSSTGSFSVDAVIDMPPEVYIAYPANNAHVSGAITVIVNASDDVGVKNVTLFRDGSIISTDTSAPYTFSWYTSAETNGAHTLSATASDASGNTATHVVTVTVDNAIPNIVITNPQNGTTVVRKSTVSITASASDNTGIARVEIYVNGDLQCTDQTAPYTCGWTVPNAPNKKYTIQGRAHDTAGNTGFSQIVTVTSVK